MSGLLEPLGPEQGIDEISEHEERDRGTKHVVERHMWLPRADHMRPR